jgi:hypothetical protein
VSLLTILKTKAPLELKPSSSNAALWQITSERET